MAEEREEDDASRLAADEDLQAFLKTEEFEDDDNRCRYDGDINNIVLILHDHWKRPGYLVKAVHMQTDTIKAQTLWPAMRDLQNNMCFRKTTLKQALSAFLEEKKKEDALWHFASADRSALDQCDVYEKWVDTMTDRTQAILHKLNRSQHLDWFKSMCGIAPEKPQISRKKWRHQSFICGGVTGMQGFDRSTREAWFQEKVGTPKITTADIKVNEKDSDLIVAKFDLGEGQKIELPIVACTSGEYRMLKSEDEAKAASVVGKRDDKNIRVVSANTGPKEKRRVVWKIMHGADHICQMSGEVSESDIFELAKQYMEQGDKDVVKKRKIELEAAIGRGTVKPAEKVEDEKPKDSEKVEDEKPKDSDTIALKPAIKKRTTENSAKPPQKKLKITFPDLEQQSASSTSPAPRSPQWAGDDAIQCLFG